MQLSKIENRLKPDECYTEDISKYIKYHKDGMENDIYKTKMSFLFIVKIRNVPYKIRCKEIIVESKIFHDAGKRHVDFRIGNISVFYRLPDEKTKFTEADIEDIDIVGLYPTNYRF